MSIFDYLTGKGGYLPDWKIPEVLTSKKATVFSVWSDPILTRKDGLKTSLKELYSPAGYAEGAGMIRKSIMDRGTASATALIGPGATAWLGGKQGFYPDWLPGGAEGQPLGKGGAAETVAEIVKDPSGAAGSLITIPEWPKFPEIPTITIPEWPTFDFAGLGAGIGAGLAGLGMPQMPQMPSLPLTDEEGDIDIMMIAALAVAGYGAVYLMTKR